VEPVEAKKAAPKKKVELKKKVEMKKESPKNEEIKKEEIKKEEIKKEEIKKEEPKKKEPAPPSKPSKPSQGTLDKESSSASVSEEDVQPAIADISDKESEEEEPAVVEDVVVAAVAQDPVESKPPRKPLPVAQSSEDESSEVIVAYEMDGLPPNDLHNSALIQLDSEEESEDSS
jgi:hypothetical protein